MSPVSFKLELIGDFQVAQADVKRLVQRTPIGITRGIGHTTKTLHGLLRSNLAGGSNVKGLAPRTRIKRLKGKLPGKWPGVPTYPGNKSLVRSGEMLKATVMKHRKYDGTIFVESRIGAVSGGRSVPLSTISVLQEHGFVTSIPVTIRMQRYLWALFSVRTAGGTKGPPSRKVNPDKRTGEVITVVVPPRPIWQETWLKSLTKMTNWFTLRFFEAVGVQFKGGLK